MTCNQILLIDNQFNLIIRGLSSIFQEIPDFFFHTADIGYMTIKGSEIVERIDERRTALNMTRKAVAVAIGLKTAQSIIDWSKGSIPQADTAIYIADALGVSVRWLLTGEEENGITWEERSLIDKFRKIDEQGQYEISALMEAKLKVRKPTSEGKKAVS